MIILFSIFTILGMFIWLIEIVDERCLISDPFFQDIKKRKIVCFLLGPGAWTAELVKITVYWISDLLTPLFDWLQSPK